MKKYKIHEPLESLDDADCMYIVGKYVSSGLMVRSKDWADMASFILAELTRWRASRSVWEHFVTGNKVHTSEILISRVNANYDKDRRRTSDIHPGKIP